jgi:predicted ATP-grasp superfamily ATP-dependent carboligase
MTHPSPLHQPDLFLAALRSEIFQRQIDVVFPMTDVTTSILVRHRDSLGHIQIPCPSLGSFETASDKWSTYNLALRLGIPMPATHCLSSEKDLSAALSALGYPIVLKPCRSRMRLGPSWDSSSVRYASSPEEGRAHLTGVKISADQPVLAQQYIKGEGRGVFAIYDRGKPVCFFAHRRLRERPPSGGVSVLSESIPVDPYLRDLTQRILDALAWHGVAMAEYKITPDATPYLLEINPRFWGSLQLAIDAGVDFPWLLYQLATGGVVNPAPNYAVGVRSRWLLGDLDHLYLTMKSRASLTEQVRTLVRFLALAQSHTRYDVNRWDDPRPFLFECRKYVFGPRQ